MTIQQAVIALRSTLGDTQQSLATKLGWSISTVQRYELKGDKPEHANLAALARIGPTPDLRAFFLATLESELRKELKAKSVNVTL